MHPDSPAAHAGAASKAAAGDTHEPLRGGFTSTRFVLVEPSHPGNVGAAARALKTMGFSRLVLVAPRVPQVHCDPEAVAMAREFMQLHLDHMPEWEGTCEVRAFMSPEACLEQSPAGAKPSFQKDFARSGT